MKRPGRFTLIELLIVISIIAMLGAILLPALNRARETARGTKCLSNVKQCYMAVFQYAGDQKSIPKDGSRSGYGAATGPWWWVAAQGKYLTIPKTGWVFTPAGIVACTGGSGERAVGIGLLYANSAASSTFGKYAEYYFSGRIRNPSSKVLLAESAGGYGYLGYSNRWIFSAQRSDDNNNSNFAAMHGGKSSIAFADGSARQVRAAQYSVDKENPCVMLNGTKTDNGSFDPESREAVSYSFARR